ncbi:ribosome small subunit-dependent GTPase A [Paludibacter sp. 221]|uniref:ribosome small subunit-dependent GTPase A n=1 Tax=Paludibacter sp. 221 TaxID=2302939 RepID=UPI0013D1FD9D|nr:ribosome small subunit-dependent GTPase A [Paludibacter sp. 221]NDV45683.1 ribosome small subunit-dependent GTPase A [Paludibacter sp. 221]
MEGLVVKNSGSSYWVKGDDGKPVECKIKGNFRIKEIKTTNPVAIGDRVAFELTPDGMGLIYEIKERKNYIIRRSSNLSKQAHIIAANLDWAALIVTVNYPETYTVFIDRFLTTAEAYRIPACIIFNKTDCYDDGEKEYLDALAYLYSTMDYPIFKVSALNPDSLKGLIDFLKGKITLFSGNSGVGKSTLINAILPDSDIKTSGISMVHNKGMHTTTFSEMYELDGGGYIIDTPGVKGFGVIDMEKNEVGHYFRDIFPVSKKCRFFNCTHIHEPGCAVLEAVENQQISQSRYQSYLSIMEDCDSGKYR